MIYEFKSVNNELIFTVDGVRIAGYLPRNRRWVIDPCIPIRQKAVLERELLRLYQIQTELSKIPEIIHQLGVTQMGKVGDGKVGNEAFTKPAQATSDLPKTEPSDLPKTEPSDLPKTEPVKVPPVPASMTSIPKTTN